MQDHVESIEVKSEVANAFAPIYSLDFRKMM